MAQERDALGKLVDLLGFDPVRESPNNEVLQKALTKISEERNASLQTRLEEQLKKAIELANRKKKLDKDYNDQSKKWEKELSGILKQLFAIRQGGEVPQEEPASAEDGNSQAAPS